MGQHRSVAISGILLLTVFLFMGGCGSSSSPRNLSFTSSVVSGHSHSFAFTEADFTAGATITRDTGVTGGHSHSVTVSPADLSTINQGGLVSIDTSNVSAHFHNFQFQTTVP